MFLLIVCDLAEGIETQEDDTHFIASNQCIACLRRL